MQGPEQTIYTDLDCLLLLHAAGDLDGQQMAFPYYDKGKVQWIHKEGLLRLSALNSAYPQSVTRRENKKTDRS